jgi:type VI secretion system secreted protein Hcp
MAADNFLWFPAAATGGLLVGKATQPEGETTDDWFSKKKAVEVSSFSFDIENPTTIGSATGGGGAGKVKFNEFTIEKFVDQASAPLFNACAAGAHFPSVMLIIRKPGGQNLLYLQFAFCMVFVKSVSWDGGGGDENWKETVKFRYGAMGFQYIQQLPTGGAGKKQQAAWSLADGTASLNVPGGSAPPAYLDGAQS